jgi:hypothetical protein
MPRDPNELHKALLNIAKTEWEVWAPTRAAFPLGQLRGAVVAVLVDHMPQFTFPSGGSVGPTPLCFGCDTAGYDWEHPDWPCYTVRTIAHVLGEPTDA